MFTDLSLEIVLQAVEEFMVGQELSTATLIQYRRYGFETFRSHFAAMNLTCYSEQESQAFVVKSRQLLEAGRLSGRHFRMIRRVHELMRSFVTTGKIQYDNLTIWRTPQLCAALQDAVDNYLHRRETDRCSELTVRGEKSIVRNFLLYAESVGITECSALTQEIAENYIIVLQGKWLSGVMDPLCILRNFLSYCADTGRTQSDLSSILNVKAATKRKAKQGFTNEETQRVLNSIDRSTDLGRRNYAMIVLAVHTGLRQIDILNLKLGDIHWREAEIRIVQHKTNRQLILPLDQETGDAIADYVLNSRPSSNSQHVFLRSLAPYMNLKVGSCIGSRIVQKYAAISGVAWEKTERKGFHSFRRDLGRNMLENGIPLNTISEVLGHSSKDSTEPYLAIDIKHLKECALSLDGIVCGREDFQ